MLIQGGVIETKWKKKEDKVILKIRTLVQGGVIEKMGIDK